MSRSCGWQGARVLARPALALLLLSGVAAGEPHAVWKDFFPTRRYLVHVGGEPDPGARLYESHSTTAFLLVASRYGRGLLLQATNQRVDAFDQAAVLAREDGGLDLPAEVELEALGRFALQGDDIVLSLGSLRARLKPRPSLLGVHDRADLLAHSPEYGFPQGELDADALAHLRPATSPVEVRVLFGSWCPLCRHAMPRIVQLDVALQGGPYRFVYVGLDKPPAAWEDPAYIASGATSLPAADVFVDGQRRGLIPHTEWIHPARALRAVLEAPR